MKNLLIFLIITLLFTGCQEDIKNSIIQIMGYGMLIIIFIVIPINSIYIMTQNKTRDILDNITIGYLFSLIPSYILVSFLTSSFEITSNFFSTYKLYWLPFTLVAILFWIYKGYIILKK